MTAARQCTNQAGGLQPRGEERERGRDGGSSRIDDANWGGEEREFQDRTGRDEAGTGRSTPARSSTGCKDQQRIAGGRRTGGGGLAISTDVPTGDWRPPQTARENLDGQDDGGQTSLPLRLSLSLTSSRTHDYCTAREKGYHHHHHQHGPELMTKRARPCLPEARYLRFHRGVQRHSTWHVRSVRDHHPQPRVQLSRSVRRTTCARTASALAALCFSALLSAPMRLEHGRRRRGAACGCGLTRHGRLVGKS